MDGRDKMDPSYMIQRDSALSAVPSTRIHNKQSHLSPIMENIWLCFMCGEHKQMKKCFFDILNATLFQRRHIIILIQS